MRRGLAQVKLIFQVMSGTEIDDVQVTVEMDVKHNLR